MESSSSVRKRKSKTRTPFGTRAGNHIALKKQTFLAKKMPVPAPAKVKTVLSSINSRTLGNNDNGNGNTRKHKISDLENSRFVTKSQESDETRESHYGDSSGSKRAGLRGGQKARHQTFRSAPTSNKEKKSQSIWQPSVSTIEEGFYCSETESLESRVSDEDDDIEELENDIETFLASSERGNALSGEQYYSDDVNTSLGSEGKNEEPLRNHGEQLSVSVHDASSSSSSATKKVSTWANPSRHNTLPKGWIMKRSLSKGGKPYYINFDLGEKTWKRPQCSNKESGNEMSPALENKKWSSYVITASSAQRESLHKERKLKAPVCSLQTLDRLLMGRKKTKAKWKKEKFLKLY